jgi:hypothetical protein
VFEFQARLLTDVMLSGWENGVCLQKIPMSVCTINLVLFAVLTELVAGFFFRLVVLFGSLLDFDERFDSLKFVFFIIHRTSIIIFLDRKLIKLNEGDSSVLWYGWSYGLIINKNGIR